MSAARDACSIHIYCPRCPLGSGAGRKIRQRTKVERPSLSGAILNENCYFCHTFAFQNIHSRIVPIPTAAPGTQYCTERLKLGTFRIFFSLVTCVTCITCPVHPSVDRFQEAASLVWERKQDDVKVLAALSYVFPGMSTRGLPIDIK